jgi:hypothetical protein
MGVHMSNFPHTPDTRYCTAASIRTDSAPSAPPPQLGAPRSRGLWSQCSRRRDSKLTPWHGYYYPPLVPTSASTHHHPCRSLLPSPSPSSCRPSSPPSSIVVAHQITFVRALFQTVLSHLVRTIIYPGPKTIHLRLGAGCNTGSRCHR